METPFLITTSISTFWGDELVAGQLYDFGLGWWFLLWSLGLCWASEAARVRGCEVARLGVRVGVRV